MRRTLILLAALASACDPCHGWGEVEIVDRDGLEDGEALASIADALEAFASWTGRETTCVGKVKLVEDLVDHGERLCGVYSPTTRNIRVRQRRYGLQSRYDTLHELCHAVDHEEGWPSLEHAEVLAPYTEGLAEAVYRTEEDLTGEAFARICEEGPTLSPLWRLVEEHCGEGMVDPAYVFVHELLFAADDSDMELGRFASTARVVEVGGLEEPEGSGGIYSAVMVAGEDGLYTLDLAALFDGDGEYEAWQPTLRHLDPGNARVLASWALPELEETPRDPIGNPYFRSHELLGSSAAPIIYDRALPGMAWRVHGDSLDLEEIAFPALPEGATLRGFEHEGALLAWVHTADEDFIAHAGLGDEAWTAVDLEAAGVEAHYIEAFTADAEGGLALVSGADGPGLVGLSCEGELLWQRSLGLPDGWVLTLSRLADGRVLAPIHLQAGGHRVRTLPLVVEPGDGALRAPDGDCGGAQYALQGVSLDGRNWMLHLPWNDDGAPGSLSLVELSIEER